MLTEACCTSEAPPLTRVTVETVSARLEITRPHEIALYTTDNACK